MTRSTADTGHEVRSRWRALIALCAELPAVQDVQQLLDLAVRKAAEFFGAECSIALLAADGGMAPAAWVGLPVPSKDVILSPDGRIREWIDGLVAPARVHHFMSAPMSTGGQTFGCLVVCSLRAERPAFDREDREMLKLMAHRIALSVECARLLEQARGRQAALARIAAALAQETEVRKVAETAATLSVTELGADAAGVWAARPRERVLELLVMIGFHPLVAAGYRMVHFDDPTIVSMVATARQTQVTESPEQVPERLEVTRRAFAAEGVQSSITLPLVVRGELMGVLGFVSKKAHRWATEELTVVNTLGDLLATAIHKARLYEELQAANKQLVQASLRSRQMAELARERAAELEATIANIADAVYVCDPRGNILLINRAGREMIGEEGAAHARTLADYLAAARVRYPDGQPVPAEELTITRALRGEVVRGVEEMIYDARAQQDRYILTSAAPVRDEKGNLQGAVEVQSDITRLKELDTLKDQFMTVAAHEIKTPLTAIKGFAQTLSRTPNACQPRYRKALETIVEQSNRIDALVQDFLDASSMRWGRPELSRQKIDLAALSADVVGRVAATTTKHRVTLAHAEPVWVNGDRERLEQVLRNLLDNACRYSPKGGDVEVRVAREGDRAVVSVRDQGVGIPRERQAHVFERFYRAHIGTPFDYGGLGVGLYISREIVRRHGGEMWFESEGGKGSTFCFSLPLSG